MKLKIMSWNVRGINDVAKRSINVTFLVLIPKKLGVEDLKELVNKA